VKGRGQVVVIVAVLIPIVLLMLAVAVDAGRLYAENARLERALQSGADAGISVVAEYMVTLAVARQTACGLTPNPETPYPSPDDITGWLTNDDRATLVSASIQATAQAVAMSYAARNGIAAGAPDVLEVQASYPQRGFNPYDAGILSLRLKLSARLRARILLAGLLGSEFVELRGEAISELRVR
jgi:hypothetical protein